MENASNNSVFLSTVFVDTSAFKAFYDPNDPRHRQARSFTDLVAAKKLYTRGFVTSDYVLDETLTLLRFTMGHSQAATFAKAIHESQAFRVLHVSQEEFSEALELFIRSKDKEWSFTDCTSFNIMKRLGVVKAFTFDPHFRQAGFQLVP